MGGPDAAAAPAGQNMAGPPDAYNEHSPLPPPWYSATRAAAGSGPRRRTGSGRAHPGAAGRAAAGRGTDRTRPMTVIACRAASRARVLCSPVLTAAVTLSSCAQWHGISNVAIPGGPGGGQGSYTVYVQMPDTLALTPNSKVMVADVYVGRVKAIAMKNWVATLTCELQSGVQLPRNATAKIGQTSLLGTQHVELAPPPDNAAPQLLRNGDTIDVNHSSAFPTTEQTLASIATLLHGGGVANLESIQNEAYNIVSGHADQIRALRGQAGHLHRQT